MMRVNILAVGRVREKWMSDGCAEYQKRLNGLCKLRILEVPEYRLSDKPSRLGIQNALEKEGACLLEKLPSGSLAAALCIEGSLLSSGDFAARLQRYSVEGKSEWSFLIGGSYGLSETAKQKADWKLSLSEMTFSHPMARLLLLEQLYRAFNFLNGGKYHK